jgi:hypothetical protein
MGAILNLRKLLGLCEHVWKLIDKAEVYRHLPSAAPTQADAVGTIYTQQCEKCGKIKHYRVTV